MSSSTRSLPFGSFHPDLDSVATAVLNKLKLEWPTKWTPDNGASTLLRGNVAVAQNTYRTIVYLCTECPDCGWRIEFTLSCTPLVRTILDSVFAAVYTFQDLPDRTSRFYRGGWRETREELDRYKATYGGKPEWVEWIDGMERLVDGFKSDIGVTPAEEAALSKSISYWPTPPQMLRDPSLDPNRKDYLQYLTDWLYRELSADTHLSLPGLGRRSAPLLEGSRKGLEKHRSDCVLTGAILLLALLSEIQLEIRWPDIKPRLEYVWTMLNSVSDIAKDLHSQRYAGKL